MTATAIHAFALTHDPGRSSALQDIPADSLHFLHDGAVRQLEELSKAKDSVDTRAAFVIGIPGIILSVFVGIFVDFWTSEQPGTLAQAEPVLFATAVVLTVSVVAFLVGAVLLGLSILVPKSFDIGTDLVHAYEVAHDPAIDTLGLQEASLRNLILSLSTNVPAYYGNVFRYILAVVSLVHAAEFVVVFLLGSNASAAPIRNLAGWVLVAVALLVVLLAFHKGWRTGRSTKGLIAEEGQRLMRFKRFLGKRDSPG